MLDKIKRGLFDKIVECSNKVTEKERAYLTCPKCNHYPLTLWMTKMFKPCWRECSKCGWTHNKPDNVELDKEQNDFYNC